MKKDTLYIIGAGAIGKALAVFLHQQRKEVCLVRASVQRIPLHPQKIRVILPGENVLESTVNSASLDQLPVLEGLLICTTKSHGNRELAASLFPKSNSSPLLLLQNGLGVEAPFLDAGFGELYRSVLFATSQFSESGSLRFRPVADSLVGVIRGNPVGLQQVVEQLENPFFPFKAEKDLEPVIWTKVIVNAVFNAVCPLLETDNGIFTRNEKALSLARNLIRETVQVARAKNLQLDEQSALAKLLQISKASSGQLISTYQDILQKRPTEIDSLHFALDREAKALGIPEATRNTRLLGELVALKAELEKAE